MLNARISPEFDDYTSKGTSVVDYFTTPHDSVDKCVKCQVTPVSELMTELVWFDWLWL